MGAVAYPVDTQFLSFLPAYRLLTCPYLYAQLIGGTVHDAWRDQLSDNLMFSSAFRHLAETMLSTDRYVVAFDQAVKANPAVCTT
jgi:hypothetical protein